eukprot:16441410-Heterocapsa_arctica.AAC.1
MSTDVACSDSPQMGAVLTPLNCTFMGTEVVLRLNFWQNLSSVAHACRYPVSSTAWSSGT